MTDESKIEPPPNSDVDPCFHPVIERFGREMFALVMGAGLAGQSAAHLAAVAGKLEGSQSKMNHRLAAEMNHAIAIVASAFNELSNSYVKKMGWPPEDVAACDSAIQVAYASKLSTLPEAKIVLH